MAKDTLTPKQRMFVKEYLTDLNALRAAQRAGYTGNDNTLGVTGNELLNNPKVAKEIQKAMDKRAKKVEIKAENILERLDQIGGVDIAKAFDEEGRLLTIHAIPAEVRQCIKSIEVFEEFEGTGKDRVQIGVIKKIQFWDKLKANELLGKHKVLFTDKLEVSASDELAERLRKSRERAKK